MREQIDVFGNEISEREMLRKVSQERKRYRSMQTLYGLKEGYQCKTCKHCELHRYHGKNYYKCALWYSSNSSATDIRISTTACNRYEEDTDESKTT